MVDGLVPLRSYSNRDLAERLLFMRYNYDDEAKTSEKSYKLIWKDGEKLTDMRDRKFVVNEKNGHEMKVMISV